MVRHGRLAAAAVAAAGADRGPRVAALLVPTAETVLPAHGPTACRVGRGDRVVLRWLEQPGTRLVELTGTWACPTHGAGGLGELLDYPRRPG